MTRRTKLATGAIALALAVGGLAVVTTAGDPGRAGADDTAGDPRYVDITTVAPNVDPVPPGADASTGTFTVDCGRNEEGHFNADNVIAQPGVANGAQHVHDYVGNLSTNSESTNESLAAAETTCANGDLSSYYWPVLRVNTEAGDGSGDGDRGNAGPGKRWRDEVRRNASLRSRALDRLRLPRVECPDVVTELPPVPDAAMGQVNRELASLDRQEAQADRRIEATRGEGGPDFVRNAVLGPLEARRAATIDRIRTILRRFGQRMEELRRLVPCAERDQDEGGIDNGGENSEGDGAPDGGQDGEFAEPQGENFELPGNEGEIQRAADVDITFRGSPAGPVSAMPRFLRVLTGQAKPTANGDALARPAFSCEGFTDRLIDRYPVCPEGSDVLRIHDFPSCWDGENIDSPNHRDHIVFPDEETGQCPDGFTAVPQLRITLSYDIPREVQEAGQYAIDSFPEENNNPASDHDDFANVMTQDIMNRVVNCINDGETCRE